MLSEGRGEVNEGGRRRETPAKLLECSQQRERRAAAARPTTKMSIPRLLAHIVLSAVLCAGCRAPSAPVTDSAAPFARPTLPPVPPADSLDFVHIQPDERHRYRLDAAAGQWLSIELWQRQVDLDLRVLDPSGDEIAAEATLGNWSYEVLDLVTESDGGYVVEVSPAADGAGRAGSYRLRLANDREARPDDAVRRVALTELREVRRRQLLFELEPAAAVGAFRRLLNDAAVDWRGEERALIAQYLGDALVAVEALDEAATTYRSGLAALPVPPEGGLAAQLVRGEAVVAQKSKRLDEAIDSYRRAASIARAAGEHAILGDVLADESRLLNLQKRHGEALARAAEAAAAKRAGGDIAGEVISLLDRVAILWTRDRAASREELEQATRLVEEAGIADPNTRYRLPVFWAAHHRHNGEIDLTQTALERAFEAARESGNNGGEINTGLHLGALLNFLGDYAEARTVLLRAADLAVEHGNDNDRAAISIQLGWAELGAGDATAARRRLLPTIEMAQLQPDQMTNALYLVAIAENDIGDHAAARARLSRAAELATENDLRVAIVDVQRALGELHLDTGDLAAAATALSVAAAGAEEMADPMRQAAVAGAQARLASERGEPRVALQRALVAIELREEVRSSIVDPSLRASFLARWRGDFDLAIEMLLRLSREEARSDHLERAFQVSEAAHARTLSELLTEARIEVRRGIAPHLLQAEQAAEWRLSRVQQELISAHARGADAERIAALEQERWQAQRGIEEIQTSIRREHPRYADLHHSRAPTVAEVQSWLPDGTALLEYALGERSSALFFLTRKDFWVFALPPAEEIAEHVRVVRDLLDAPALTRGRLAAELAALSRLLLAPAAGRLGGSDRLLVVPDRDLFYLPFEALADPADPAGAPGGALRRWTITYLPSAAVIPHFEHERPKIWEREVLLLADPPPLRAAAGPDSLRGESDLLPAGGLGSLPGAQHEAQRIAELFAPQADIFVGEDARESLLKTQGALRPARRLHIASHGYISELDPAASYVLLASDATEDGLLQIHEVFNLDLPAELVVLSGCETALGHRVDGEGLLGLARAFLYAGARQLVVSLFPVPDTETGKLMIDLYRYVAAGLGPDEALRRAKLGALDAGAPPAVWAPFVIFASPQATPAIQGNVAPLFAPMVDNPCRHRQDRWAALSMDVRHQKGKNHARERADRHLSRSTVAGRREPNADGVANRRRGILSPRW